MMTRRVIRLLLALLIVSGLFASPRLARPAMAAGSYTGWVLDAYPSMSASDFSMAFGQMRALGANMVWIGHNNPVDVDPNGREVALSYAVYAAARNPADPRNAAAQSIIAAQRRALDAARQAGLKAVLPIGYRTQMGADWNGAHQGSLRRGPDGAVLDFGGVDASPYAADFRADTAAYDAWIEQQFVAPYRDVILMVMLANEPTGVDYSQPADAAFFGRYGYHFADVGSDPRRITELGNFQSHVMVDYTVWAAQQWLALDPSLTVTIAYDGTPARKNEQGPELEDLFRLPPSNFQPAWDTQIRNGAPTDGLDDTNVADLGVLAGTLGHFSAKYNRPYWLWSAGNSWGLGQGSGDPSNIADALVNLHLLADVSKQAGGDLRGIAVWAYNVRGQGLFNDAYHPIYDPAALFQRVSQALPAIRHILDGPPGPGPNAIVLAPYAMPYRLIGSSRLVDIWAFRGYNFADLISLIRAGANTAVVNTLAGEDLSHVRLIAVLAREPSDITSQDVAAIKAFRGRGGAVVASDQVNSSAQLNAQWSYPGNAPEASFTDKNSSANTGPIEALGLPRMANSFVFKGPSELTIYGGASLDPPSQMQASVRLPSNLSITEFGPAGDTGKTIQAGPGLVAVPTQRHTFALAPLVPAASTGQRDGRYFPQTGFRVDDDTIWDYFTHRGGLRTFGYPVSRAFTFEGFRTQLFQREIVQIAPDGSPRTLNLLDAGLLPYTTFNYSTFPAPDQALIAAAPAPGSPDYGRRAIAWAMQQAPDSWNGLPVNFGQRFLGTVSLADAFPGGRGDPALIPLLNLELWGLPTSRPAFDPNNHGFVYQRFQRGIMHYDAGCHCTQGILLADYLKAVLTGHNLPADLAREAASSPFYQQYDPTAPNWVHNPVLLPNTDLTQAFTPR